MLLKFPEHSEHYKIAEVNNKVRGKKGYPKYKKHGRSVEYKSTGWKLSGDRKYLTLTDKHNIGTLKLKGTYDLHFYDPKQIKRVRLVRPKEYGFKRNFRRAFDSQM